jgi:hypothetical protein
MSFLEALYSARRPIVSLGAAYQPPQEFKHGAASVIAKLPAEPDGYAVEVLEERLPARFFTVKALPTADSTGKIRPGFRVTTGSGDDMGEIAGEVAKAIAGGMIGFHPEEST